jgi:peptidoglycan/xylan/chitin deacetylase (PgdA/CDA1 family)
MSWNFYLKSFTVKKNSSKKHVALTFDDGPNPIYTEKVLKLLAEYDAKATFFCIGKHIKKHPDMLKSISNGGHVIGNHSYSHSTTIDFNNKGAWIEEITKTDAAIERVIGYKPKLFRPPYGVTTPHLSSALSITSHKNIGWNIRTYDTAIKNEKVILKRITTRLKPGSIILLHDKHAHIIPVLEQLLNYLKINGFTMVTINELLDEN